MYLFKRYTATGIAGFVGISLSIVATFMVHRWEIAKDRERFEQQSMVLVGELQRQLDSYIQLTRSVGALFNTAKIITRQEFQEFSNSLLPYYNGLLGLGWTEKVDAQERQIYEQKLQTQGIINFRIHENDSTGTQVVARDRPVYFPTTYFEPLDRWRDYISWDAVSDPKRLRTIKKAERLGVSVSTPLVQLENGKPGFVLYSPVFTSNNTNAQKSLNNKQLNSLTQFQGVVFGLFELQTFIEKAIAHLDLNGLDFYLYSLPEDQLDSALNKAAITATEFFLIAYKADSETLTKSAQVANVDFLDSPIIQSSNPCHYTNEWQFCIRSLNLARQELSLLVLPSGKRYIYSWRPATVLAFGLLATGCLMMYLLISKQTMLKVENKNRKLKELLQQLKQTQLQLVQTEKMSSLGRLVAGVAHEINNPVNFITANVEYANQYCQDLLYLLDLYQTQYPVTTPEIEAVIEDIELDFMAQDLPSLLNSMKVGGKRIKEIVLSLRNFSRLDESEVKDIDIHTGIESTLMILDHQLKAHFERPEIKVKKEYGNIPLIKCYAGQLNQVFMNILSNAIDALQDSMAVGKFKERSPLIFIKTAQVDAKWITIQIADNGPGIAPDIQAHLFEPFFTTKPVGQGIGLGLSISYQIVREKHGGDLICSSEQGKSTEFIIKLPIAINS